MRSKLLVGLILLLPFIAHSQLKQLMRYEVEQKESDDAFTAISMKENGIALFRANNKYEEGKRIWELNLLNSELEETWKTEIQLENRFNLVGHEYAAGRLYLLFRDGDTDDNDIHILKLDIESKEIYRSEIKHDFKFKLTHFCVVNDNIILGGYVSREPAVLLFDLATRQLKIIPGFFVTDTELLDMRSNENGSFNTLVMERGTKDNKRLVFKTFNSRGDLLLDDEITIPSDKTLLSGMTSTLKRDEMIIIGSYGFGNSRMASGVFTVNIDPFNAQTIQFYDFSQFEHFFDYLNPKRVKKIKSKAERARLMGKSPDYRTNIIPVKIEELQEGFLFLSEVYQASSQNNHYQNNNTYYNPNYNPYSYGNYPFTYNPYSSRYYNSPYSFNNSNRESSVKMIESVLIQFTPQGKLKWDESLKLEDIRSEAMEQSSDVTIKDQLALAYKREDKIYYMLAGSDSQSIDTLSIRGSKEYDIVRSESQGAGAIRQWYDGFFYVWGFQSIRNYSLEDRNRSVYYIVKLGFE